MKKFKTFLLALIASIALVSCGGSGGDGDDATNVSGIWSGTLLKRSDNCVPSGPASIVVMHNVSQNEDAVSLTAESGVVFIGNTVGENGFSVDGSHSTIGAPSCSDQTRISYDSIGNDSDSTGDITITINRTCPDSAECRLEYFGNGVR